MQQLTNLALLLKKHSISLGILLFLCLLVTRTLFATALPRTHDGELHGARLANYYLAIKQGQFPPRWAPNLNYDFGYPIFLYNYHLPYLIATVFYAADLSIEQSLNAVTVLSLISVGLGWYCVSFFLSKNRIWSVTMAGVLITAPYVLLNVFVRGAIGEVVFAAFIPWVILCLELFLQERNKRYLLFFIPSFFCLLISHHILSMLFSPFLLIYGVLRLKETKYRAVPWLWLSFFISFSLAGFFYLPLAFEKDLIRLADDASVSNFSRAFVSFKDIIWSEWNYGGMNGDTSEQFTRMIGLPLFIGLCLLLQTFRKKRKLPVADLFLLTTICVGIFLMTKYSFFIWNTISFLQYLQFPWRLLQLILIALMLVMIRQFSVFDSFPKLLKKTALALSWVWIFFIAIVWAKPISFISNSDHDWREYGKTADASEEFMPKSFDQHKNYAVTEEIIIRKPGDVFGLHNPELRPATASILSWTGTLKVYEIVTLQKIEVIEKTVNFPGWQVIKNGEKVNVHDSHQFPGRVVFFLEPGNYRIESFWSENTWPRKLGNSLSFIGIGLYLGTLLLILTKRM